MFVPDPDSEFFPSLIQGQKDSWILDAHQEFKYLNPKIVSKLSDYDPGCSSRIRVPDPDLEFLPIPDPGVKKAPDPGPQHWC